MKNYKLLSENDLIPNNRYRAIVYYPYPSPNRNPMVDSVYYDMYKDWSGTDKDIAHIIDESIISVLFEYNPERACEIIEGGFTEDGRFNDILSGYDFKLQEKYKKYYMNKAKSESTISLEAMIDKAKNMSEPKPDKEEVSRTKENLFKKLHCPEQNDKILLVTHNDLDGEGPAVLLKEAYPPENITVVHCSNAEMSDKIEAAVTENSKTGEYNAIIACDISCSREAAERINNIEGIGNFILLDHHKTAEWLNEYPWAVVSNAMPEDSFRRGLLPDTSKEEQALSSGTSLLYDFLESNGKTFHDDSRAMILTHMIASYDTWMWKTVYQGNTRFKDINSLYYIRGTEDFESHALKYIRGEEELITELDKKLLEIEERRTKEAVEDISKGFKTGTLEINGKEYSAVFVTASQHMPAVFERMQQMYPELDLYIMNTGKNISFRATKPDIDVSEIAALAGGGGHKGAAGISADLDAQIRFMADVMQIEPYDIQIDSGLSVRDQSSQGHESKPRPTQRSFNDLVKAAENMPSGKNHPHKKASREGHEVR